MGRSMKNYRTAMSLLIFVCFAQIATIELYSQPKGQWSHQIAADFGMQFPMGVYTELFELQDQNLPLKTNYDLVLSPSTGFSGTYYLRTSERLFFSLSGGYLKWNTDSLKYRFNNAQVSKPLNNSTLSATTILVGARYLFATSGLQPYVGLEAGVSSFSLDLDTTTAKDFGKTRFTILPKIGLRYPVGDGIDFDLNLKYLQTFGDANFGSLGFNLGVAYTFRELTERVEQEK